MEYQFIMNIKRIIKCILTYIKHPIISIKLLKDGTRNFCIGKNITINGWKGFDNLHCNNGVYIGNDSRFLFVTEYAGEEYKPEIRIGKDVCIENRFSALAAAPIIIGDNCLFASDVMITSENHGMNPEETSSYSKTKLLADKVVIGDGCWLGEKVSILPGVTLGQRTIVAAGAVVTKSFPAYSLIGGVPARLLKTYNFEKHIWESVNNKND